MNRRKGEGFPVPQKIAKDAKIKTILPQRKVETARKPERGIFKIKHASQRELN
jgi:hypothetical protein